ncbi:MAG: universal stress protein, partial [Acidobacteriota bacterium]
MDGVKRILAPTDLSGLSGVGVRYALEMARSQGAEVIVYHITDYRAAIPYQERKTPHLRTVEEFLDEDKKGIDKFLREAFPDLVSKVRLRQEVGVGVAHEG